MGKHSVVSSSIGQPAILPASKGEDFIKLLADKDKINFGLAERVKHLENELNTLKIALANVQGTSPSSVGHSLSPTDPCMFYANSIPPIPQPSPASSGFARILPKPSPLAPVLPQALTNRHYSSPNPAAPMSSTGYSFDVSLKKTALPKKTVSGILRRKKVDKDPVSQPPVNASNSQIDQLHSYPEYGSPQLHYANNQYQNNSMYYNPMQQTLISSSVSLFSRSPDTLSYLGDDNRSEILIRNSGADVFAGSIHDQRYYDNIYSDRESIYSVGQLNFDDLNLAGGGCGNHTDAASCHSTIHTTSQMPYQPSEFYFSANPTSFEEDMDMLQELLNTNP